MTQQIEPLEPLLKEKQVAGILNVSQSALRQWRRQGVGPPYLKIGEAVRYRQNAVRAYIEMRARYGSGPSVPHKNEIVISDKFVAEV